MAKRKDRIEELLFARKEILRSGNGRQVPCRKLTDSSLGPSPEGLGLTASCPFNFRQVYEIERKAAAQIGRYFSRMVLIDDTP